MREGPCTCLEDRVTGKRGAGWRGGAGQELELGTEPSLSSGAWGIFALRNKGMEIVLGTIPSPCVRAGRRTSHAMRRAPCVGCFTPAWGVSLWLLVQPFTMLGHFHYLGHRIGPAVVVSCSPSNCDSPSLNHLSVG